MSEPPLVTWVFHPNPVVIALLVTLVLVIAGLAAGAIGLWLTRDKGTRAAPRGRTWPQRLGTLWVWAWTPAAWCATGALWLMYRLPAHAGACLHRAHLPRGAAQARTWAQHAIARRIRRTPPPRHAGGCREPFSAWESDTFVNGLTAIKGDE